MFEVSEKFNVRVIKNIKGRSLVVIDNFYKNPDEIRELGLRSVEPNVGHKSNDGRWPGYRSEDLNKIDVKLNQRIMTKILNCYWNLGHEQIFWNQCKMRFNLIPKLDKDKNNLKNRGWIHRDDGYEFGGVIYLNKYPEKDTGTSIYEPKKLENLFYNSYSDEIRNKFYGGVEVTDDEYEIGFTSTEDNWKETVKVENVYNRLFAFILVLIPRSYRNCSLTVI